MSASECAICAAPAPLKCSACQLASYCNKGHQRDHWKTHKTQCRAYEERNSPELGRHLIATRDVPAEGLILSEAPLVVGPRHHDNPPAVCVGCLCALSAQQDPPCRCAACLWPACSPDCPGLGDPHRHAAECRVLQAGRHVLVQGNLRYEALLPLRCLLLQKTAPSKWKAVQTMNAHMLERGPGSVVHTETQERIVGYLRDNFLSPLSVAVSGPGSSLDSVAGLLEDCSAETLHKLVAVLDVNALEICAGSADLSALYPTAYLMEHSCVPNTRHTFDCLMGDGNSDADSRFKIFLRAAVNIKKGEHIATMYTHMLWGTLARREHLRGVKAFSCCCARCSDPSELGSMVSALRCLSCGGTLLPTEPLQDMADWRCDGCGALLAAEHAIQIVASLDEQVGAVLHGNKPDAQQLEDVVNKLERLLHPNHYHCLQMKHSLLQMYGSQPGLEMDRLSEVQLERKASLCRGVLSVLLQLDSSLSRLQLYAAVCLLELQRAELERLKRGGRGGRGGQDLQDVQDLRSLLSRALHTLRHETPGTDGARMADAVRRAQQEMEVWARVKKLA